MAIVHNGTQNKIPVFQIPSGYTKPSVTTFEDYEYPRELILEVDKATVQNASAATTMANIFNDAAIGLNKQIEDILAADFLATATVVAFADLESIRTNYSDLNSTSDYLKTTAPKYLCTVKLFVKAS